MTLRHQNDRGALCPVLVITQPCPLCGFTPEEGEAEEPGFTRERVLATGDEPYEAEHRRLQAQPTGREDPTIDRDAYPEGKKKPTGRDKSRTMGQAVDRSHRPRTDRNGKGPW